MAPKGKQGLTTTTGGVHDKQNPSDICLYLGGLAHGGGKVEKTAGSEVIESKIR